ncbi:MAG: pilin [Candidatus Pacebacteria bacterium]|nr:pilin [Candidatus Paceibacterota bacterium]
MSFGKNIKSYSVFLPLCAVCFLLPFFAAAASVKEVFERGTDIVLQIIQLLWLVASVVFIFGVLRYITTANNPEKRKSAKNFLIYGLIGFFVLLSFWGLIRILQDTVFGQSPSDTYYDYGYDATGDYSADYYYWNPPEEDNSDTYMDYSDW